MIVDGARRCFVHALVNDWRLHDEVTMRLNNRRPLVDEATQLRRTGPYWQLLQAERALIDQCVVEPSSIVAPASIQEARQTLASLVRKVTAPPLRIVHSGPDREPGSDDE